MQRILIAIVVAVAIAIPIRAEMTFGAGDGLAGARFSVVPQPTDTSALLVSSQNATTVLLKVNTAGLVGIGTSIPSSKLTVFGSANDGVGVAMFGHSNTGNSVGVSLMAPVAARYAVVFYGVESTRTWSSGMETTGNFVLHDERNGTNNLLISSNTGNVAIGGSEYPASKLHISSGTITMIGTGAPTAGYALCLTASGAMGHCTTVVGVTGDCTCTTP